MNGSTTCMNVSALEHLYEHLYVLHITSSIMKLLLGRMAYMGMRQTTDMFLSYHAGGGGRVIGG